MNSLTLGGNNMSIYKRLLEPGCTELPPCQCGHTMKIIRMERHKGADSPMRIYECQTCRKEMRLAIWTNEAV